MNSHSPRTLLMTVFALLFLTAVTYQSGINNVFHFDDRPNITENRAIQIKNISIEELGRVVSDASLRNRVLPNLSFAIDWWRGGGDPATFQFTNICIHLLNTLLVFCLLLMIFGSHKTTGNHHLLAAFFAAALWALHPIQLQSVTYIVQRMNSMASLFMLLSVATYLFARLHARHPVFWFVLCLISFLCGAISKENAWITPLLILLAEYGVCRRETLLWSRGYDRLLLALPWVVGLYLLVDLSSQTGPFYDYVQPFYEMRDFSMVERLLTQPRVILFHLSQILWPLPDRFSIEHDFIKSTGLLSPITTLFALLSVISACCAGLYALLQPHTRMLGFFILWIPCSLIVESSFIPLEMVFEHRLYLPMFGIAGLFGVGFIALSRRSEILKIATQLISVLIIAGLMASTIARLPVWSSELSLVKQAIKLAPNSARVWNNLGTVNILTGNHTEGLQAFEQALKIAPDSARLWDHFGRMNMAAGKHGEALDAFNRAIELDPGFAPSFKNRGLYYLQQLSRPESALRDLNRSIDLDPEQAASWLERGNVHAAMGQALLAEQDYSTAIRLNPEYALAYNNRGLLFLQAGDIINAMKDFDRSIEYDNNYQPVYVNRATALLTMRDFTAASEGFLKAISMQADDASAHYHLAICLRALGRQGQATEHFKRACEFGMQKACQYTSDGL